MKKSTTKNNVLKFKKPFQLNIGMIIFLIISIYILFNVFSYLTAKHVSPYEVEQGTIAENNIYNGLILRDETVYQSSYSGTLNYYVKETSKVGANNLVYSVDENGSVSSIINEANQDGTKLTGDGLTAVEDAISNYQSAYSAVSFYNVYSFKENLDSTVKESLSLNALNQISDYVSTAEENQTFHRGVSDTSGVVVYYTDGFEQVTPDNFSSEMFDESVYTRNNLKSNTSITSGADVYKLISSEVWRIVVSIPQNTADRLAGDSTIQIRFVEDHKTAYASYEIITRESQNYLVLTLNNSMVRYAKERYIEVELLLSEETGLKIPNSSIIEKNFFTIPTEYFLKGGDSNERGLLVETINKDGSSTTEFIVPTIYYETDTMCYIDDEEIPSGAVLVLSDSTQKYTVGDDVASLVGVYNINKGYAVFKQIEIIYRNEEYSIIKTNTSYGISLFDHIALDGSKVQENDLIE